VDGLEQLYQWLMQEEQRKRQQQYNQMPPLQLQGGSQVPGAVQRAMQQRQMMQGPQQQPSMGRVNGAMPQGYQPPQGPYMPPYGPPRG
jgi:hypothetical protein